MNLILKTQKSILIAFVVLVFGLRLAVNPAFAFQQKVENTVSQIKQAGVRGENDQPVVAISFQQEPGGVVVNAGDELFTRYDYATYAKPILYPVFGPDQLPMTRNTPMKPTPGEASDHPHHKSMWLGHFINGVDFWTETGGSVKHDSLRVEPDKNQFISKSDWIRKDGVPICSDESTYRFGASAQSRWIDATHVFYADHGDIRFEDTKEGTFAIRTHPSLRLSPDEKQGVKTVSGQALNSNGTTGKAIWGESANWVYYWGSINGKTVGIAMFDHPSNLRHPTTWHAREYGLIAANPFGLHYFKNEPKGAGAYVVKNGDTLSLRYRVVFQLGQQTAEELNRQFEKFSQE